MNLKTQNPNLKIAVAKFKRNSVSVENKGRLGSQAPVRSTFSTEDWFKRSLFSTVVESY